MSTADDASTQNSRSRLASHEEVRNSPMQVAKNEDLHAIVCGLLNLCAWTQRSFMPIQCTKYEGESNRPPSLMLRIDVRGVVGCLPVQSLCVSVRGTDGYMCMLRR